MLSGGKVVFFYWFVALFSKKYGSFSPNIFGKNFLLSKSVFGYFNNFFTASLGVYDNFKSQICYIVLTLIVLAF